MLLYMQKFTSRRHRLPHFPLQHFSIGMFIPFHAIAAPGAPLFEEKGRALFFALCLNLQYPFFFHGSGFGSALMLYADIEKILDE